VNGALGGKTEVFYRNWTLVAFFATLVPLSFLSYRFFELPALKFLRSRLDGPGPEAKPVPEAVPVPTVN